MASVRRTRPSPTDIVRKRTQSGGEPTDSITKPKVNGTSSTSNGKARAIMARGVWKVFGMPTSAKDVNNLLLRALPRESYARLEPKLATVQLELGKVLMEPGDEAKSAYFPGTECLISLIATTPDDESAEVAIVGPEGLVGHSVLLGQKKQGHRCLVQIGGPAFRISAQALADACYADGNLMRVML